MDDLTETEWKIGELDVSFCDNEIEALDGLITETKNFIYSQNSGNRTITDYKKGSCFKSQTYLALKGKQEAYQKYYDENKKEIEEANRQQQEISASLESSFIKEKQAEATMNGVSSIVLSTIPGIGDIKDVQEAVMGIDIVTGEKLSRQERGIKVMNIKGYNVEVRFKRLLDGTVRISDAFVR